MRRAFYHVIYRRFSFWFASWSANVRWKVRVIREFLWISLWIGSSPLCSFIRITLISILPVSRCHCCLSCCSLCLSSAWCLALIVDLDAPWQQSTNNRRHSARTSKYLFAVCTAAFASRRLVSVNNNLVVLYCDSNYAQPSRECIMQCPVSRLCVRTSRHDVTSVSQTGRAFR